MNTIQEVSKHTLKIENVLSSATPGEFLSYKQIQELSGVQMDNKGKGYMRSALKRLKLPVETISGKGIKIISKDNATSIVVSKVQRIDSSIRKAEKTTKQVRDRVYNELPEVEQKNINFLSALFGTIRSYSQSAKKIFNKPVLTIGEKIK